MTLALYVAIFIAHRNVYEAEYYLQNKKMYEIKLKKKKKKKKVFKFLINDFGINFNYLFYRYIWLNRALLNNGLVFYATWLTIATSLNFSIAWTYEWVDTGSVSSKMKNFNLIILDLLKK